VSPARTVAAGFLGAILSATGSLLAAQRAPAVVEWGLHGTFTAVDGGPVGLVAGPRVALRTAGGTRAALSLGGGIRGDRVSARGEAALEYLVSPRAAGRVGVYLGGGLAGVLGAGEGGYLVVYLGLEKSPGLPSGWAIEAGLGSGYRIRAAWHWRHFPPGWRVQQ
jgi:hypothetical protein